MLNFDYGDPSLRLPYSAELFSDSFLPRIRPCFNRGSIPVFESVSDREKENCSLFLVALGSPFGKTLYTAISAPAALCDKGSSAYLPFFNGLTQCSIKGPEVSM